MIYCCVQRSGGDRGGFSGNRGGGFQAGNRAGNGNFNQNNRGGFNNNNYRGNYGGPSQNVRKYNIIVNK